MTIAGLILAGGRSTRMGGGDKATTLLGGRTLLDRSIERLVRQVDEIAVSSNRMPALLRDMPVLADATQTHEGPLAGIHAGLVWAQSRGHSALASAAVDTPFFPHDLVHRLSDGDPARIRVASSAGRAHPVFALWPIEALEPLAAFLGRAETRKVMAFLAEFGFEAVEFQTDPFDPFFNVNTPDDLAQVERFDAMGAA